MIYYLMNKDKPIAKLDVGRSYANIIEVYDDILGYVDNIQEWIGNRTEPVNRSNIHNLLKLAQIYGKSEFLDVTKGISLIDTFWFKSLDDKNTTWDKINPYRNEFNKDISEVALNGVYTGGNVKSPSPDYKVDGSVDKCWKRENGEIYLYKTAGEKWSGLAGNRPWCEYYASQVASALCIDPKHFVKYEIVVNKTNEGYLKPYVKCPIFTSEKFGYAAIANTRFSAMDLKELDKLMDDRSRIILREMLILDSLIVNFDRHQGNYGFLVNNDSYEILGMNPIFDNDCSLGAMESLQDKTKEQVYQNLIRTREAKTDMGGYIAQARWAMTGEIRSNIKNMYPFKFDRLPSNIDLDNKRIEFMEYIVNSQIRAIFTK